MLSRARIAALVLVVAAFVLSAGIASAQTASATLNVSANVAENCTISAAPLAFGSYDSVTGTAVTGNTPLTITCTRGVVASIELNDGGNSPAAGTRRMATGAGTDFLTYDLFQNADFSTRWGAGGSAYSWTSPNRASHALTVYGRINANQDAVAGAYTDQIQVTVNY